MEYTQTDQLLSRFPGVAQLDDDPRTAPDEPTLTKLGNPNAQVDGVLEVIKGYIPNVGEVHLHCTEFTCRCPITRQPDWAVIDIRYGPDGKIVESKSVKMYLETWRDRGIFHERLAQRILEDFVKVLEPLWLEVVVRFNTRGGIAITASASWTNKEKTNG